MLWRFQQTLLSCLLNTMHIYWSCCAHNYRTVAKRMKQRVSAHACKVLL
jgi:hypothetical protein